MIWQNCVVCGTPVDVDTVFGVVGEAQTYCDKHEDERIFFDKLSDLRLRLHQLQIEMDDFFKVARQRICKAEYKSMIKKSHDGNGK